MKIALIDYGGGNVMSVKNALLRIGQSPQIIRSPENLFQFDKVIFPGQGAAGQAMKALIEREFINPLQYLTVPFLGICLGLQLLFERSEENETEGLGLVQGCTKRLTSEPLKIPHMGWNAVKYLGKNPLFEGIPDESYFYFVHSFAAPIIEETCGITFYDTPFSSAIQKNNFFGVQFHPEKSGEVGLRLL